MNHPNIGPEKKLFSRTKEYYENEFEEIDEILHHDTYSSAYVKELTQRNMVLLEALRKVKLLVDKLMKQNRELKRRVEFLEQDLRDKEGKGIKIVSAARYHEMQKNAAELSRSFPKMLKLIKLLNSGNKLLQQKYSALESEFADLINERDELRDKIRNLNETNQRQVLTELTELFPSDMVAEQVAEAITENHMGKIVKTQTELKPEQKVSSFDKLEKATEDKEAIRKQAEKDLDGVGTFNNEQISKLVDLVTTINTKIEQLSGNMVVASPSRIRRRGGGLDLSGAITEGDLKKSDEPPERPDLESVLDDILISD